MKDLMISLLSILAIFVAAIVSYDLLIYTPQNSSAKVEEIQPANWVEAYPMDPGVQFTACEGSETIADAQQILVSFDVAECNQPITVKLIDGSVVSGVVSAILEYEPMNTIRIYNLAVPQVTEIVVH